MSTENPPAFPVTVLMPYRKGTWKKNFPGLSLRDYFAAKALQAIIGFADNPKCQSKPDDLEGIERERQEFALATARQAYRAADAMLKARTEDRK